MQKILKVGGNTLTILFDSKKFASLCSTIASRNKRLPKICFSKKRGSTLGSYNPLTNTISVYLEDHTEDLDHWSLGHWFAYLKNRITSTLLHEIYHWKVARPLFAWLYMLLLIGGLSFIVWVPNLTVSVPFYPSIHLHLSFGIIIAAVLSVVHICKRKRKEETEAITYGYGAYDSLRKAICSCIDIKREKS